MDEEDHAPLWSSVMLRLMCGKTLWDRIRNGLKWFEMSMVDWSMH